MANELYELKDFSEVLKTKILNLIEKYYSKTPAGRRWKDVEVAAIEPFIPSFSLVLFDIYPDFNLEVDDDGFYILNFIFENEEFALTSLETFIETASFGSQGNLNIKNMFQLHETKLIYNGEDNEKVLRFINKFLEILESYLGRLRLGDINLLLSLRNRSISVRSKEKLYIESLPSGSDK